MGEGAAEAGEPEHRHLSCGQQGELAYAFSHDTANEQLDLVSDSPAKAAAPAKPTESEETDAEADAEENEETASPTSPTLADDEDARQVLREEAETYAKESNLLFFEASAKVSFRGHVQEKELTARLARTCPSCSRRSPRRSRSSRPHPSRPRRPRADDVLRASKSTSATLNRRRREAAAESADRGFCEQRRPCKQGGACVRFRFVPFALPTRFPFLVLVQLISASILR